MAEEYFDVLDENGQKTGQTKLRSAVHRDGNMWGLSCGGHVTASEEVRQSQANAANPAS